MSCLCPGSSKIVLAEERKRIQSGFYVCGLNVWLVKGLRAKSGMFSCLLTNS